MKRFLIALFAILALARPAFAVPEPGALCTPEEEALFSCRLEASNKLISLCASPGISKEKGYLQYRAGDFKKVEEEFPQRKAEYRTLFNYVRVFPVGSNRTSLSFVNNGAVYEIFVHDSGPPNPVASEKGLRIQRPDGKDSMERCRVPAIDKLAKLEQIF